MISIIKILFMGVLRIARKERVNNIFSKKYVFIPFGYNITEIIAKIKTTPHNERLRLWRSLAQQMRSVCPSYAVILHRIFLKSVRIPAKFLYNLTNKSVARSNANHYAV